jgi:hypothetical protein
MQEEKKQIRVLLRLASSGRVCSLLAPSSWTIKKLKSFIGYAFKEEVKTNAVILYHGAKQLINDNILISNFLQENQIMVQIIVMFKPKENLSELQKSSLQISILPDESKKKEIVRKSLKLKFYTSFLL